MFLVTRKTDGGGGGGCKGGAWCRKCRTNEEQVRVQVPEKTDQAAKTRFRLKRPVWSGEGENLCVLGCAHGVRVRGDEADHRLPDTGDISPGRSSSILW